MCVTCTTIKLYGTCQLDSITSNRPRNFILQPCCYCLFAFHAQPTQLSNCQYGSCRCRRCRRRRRRSCHTFVSGRLCLSIFVFVFVFINMSTATITIQSEVNQTHTYAYEHTNWIAFTNFLVQSNSGRFLCFPNFSLKSFEFCLANAYISLNRFFSLAVCLCLCLNVYVRERLSVFIRFCF